MSTCGLECHVSPILIIVTFVRAVAPNLEVPVGWSAR